ncbi:MAG: M16 family metallopeptidase [Sandaracinaceae bacterium]
MRRALTLGCAALVLGSCGGSQSGPREYPRMTEDGQGQSRDAAPLPREALADAPRLVTEPSASSIVTLRVAFDAGSASDPAGREGITMVTARTMAEGGAGELSFAELSRRLYPMAGTISAQVSRDETVFIGQVHADHLDAFYELFRDVLTRPRLSEEDFERVRDQVMNELAVDLRSSNDEALGKEALELALYEGHPYGHPAEGTVAGLRRLRIDDVRAHRDQELCAGRATIGIAGSVPEGFAQRMERDLSRLSSGACVGRQALPAPPSHEGPRVFLVHKPDAQAVAVSMGFAYDVRRDHPDYPAMVLAAAWLGQHRQFIGRLMQAIRGERGLNYGDYAYAEEFTQEGWSRFPVTNDARRQQHFSIWLRPLRPETAHFAIRLAVRELDRLVREGLTREQLDHVRTFLTQYYALYTQTASRRLGYAMDDAFYASSPAYVERLRAGWAELTPESLHEAIRRHLDPSRLTIAIVASDANELADAIASDAASPITYATTVSAEVTAEDREIVGYPLHIPRERIRIVPVSQLFER